MEDLAKGRYKRCKESKVVERKNRRRYVHMAIRPLIERSVEFNRFLNKRQGGGKVKGRDIIERLLAVQESAPDPMPRFLTSAF